MRKFLKFFSSDSLNPIFIRELRQMVRNKVVLVVINLYLLLMVICFSLFVYNYTVTSANGEMFGYELFGMLAAVTTGVTGLTVALYSGYRVAVDRINEDLLFFTSLSPSQNLRGRIVCGFVISLLFFSLSSPFLISAYF
ncbi:MAG: hypothetical protein LBL39_02640, partial [Planctomycetaceae bacterium]|nr:hypothetical protein [Planctomycetaceae bacterium]